MKGNSYKYLISFVMFMVLASFANAQTIHHCSSANPSGPRTIIIEGTAISEVDAEGFTSWSCKENSNDDSIAFEVGFFNSTEDIGVGFILFDGGYSGEVAMYRRVGLDRRWKWGPNVEYAFVLHPDGTGHFCDYSKTGDGESTTADELYRCYQNNTSPDNFSDLEVNAQGTGLKE